MNNNQKRTNKKDLDYLKQNRAMSSARSGYAIALLSSLFLLLAACEAPQTTTTTPSSDTDTTVNAPQANTESPDLEDVAENTEQLIGQTVTVEGEVENIVGANAFRMQENELFGGDEVLIVNANPTVPISDDQNIRVTGEVRQFVVADFERDYDLNWDLEVQQQLEAEYQNKPVIVAESIEAI